MLLHGRQNRNILLLILLDLIAVFCFICGHMTVRMVFYILVPDEPAFVNQVAWQWSHKKE